MTSHVPVAGKRHEKLAALLSGTRAGLAPVAAFTHRAPMARCAGESHGNGICVAGVPSRLIPFTGDGFWAHIGKNKRILTSQTPHAKTYFIEHGPELGRKFTLNAQVER